MAPGLWFKDGKIVWGTSGPQWCEDCPCGMTYCSGRFGENQTLDLSAFSWTNALGPSGCNDCPSIAKEIVLDYCSSESACDIRYGWRENACPNIGDYRVAYMTSIYDSGANNYSVSVTIAVGGATGSSSRCNLALSGVRRQVVYSNSSISAATYTTAKTGGAPLSLPKTSEINTGQCSGGTSPATLSFSPS